MCNHIESSLNKYIKEILILISVRALQLLTFSTLAFDVTLVIGKYELTKGTYPFGIKQMYST